MNYVEQPVPAGQGYLPAALTLWPLLRTEPTHRLTGHNRGRIRNPLWLSLREQLKSERGPFSEMLQAFRTNTRNVQKSQFSAAR